MSWGGTGEPRVVADRYELAERIGVGANAYVYAAIDRRTGDRVALKLLLPAFADDPEFVTRFRREARAALSLAHPNVVRVLDFGTDGDAYLAMELVRGGDLSRRLMRGALPVAEAVRVGMRVADALEAAHAHGLVHRDVKPQNILLDEDGEPKLADFGVARAMWLTQLTRTNVIFGSPHYISPEQARGVRVDERADVYGLGVVLYEMLAGRPPFVGDSPVAIALQHVNERPAPLRSIRPDVPRALEAVVHRALAKDPRARYQSARELGAALAATLPPTAREPRRPARVALALPALLLVALVAGGAVVAAPLFQAWRVDRNDAALASPAATSTPPASVTIAPTAAATLALATPTPSPVSTPAATPTPTPNPAASSPAAIAAAPQAAAQAARSGGPADAVSRFYAAIAAHNLDAALALWDERMRTSYPPATYLYHRFAATSSIALNAASVVAQTDATAIVAVDISEIDGGTRRHWVGYWYLVRGSAGWLLDQPALAAA